MARKKKRSSKDAQEGSAWFNSRTGEFTDPDYKAWAEENLIEQRGADDGREGFPPADQGTMDRTHIEIESYVSDMATECRREVSQYLADLMGSINSVHDETGLQILTGRAKGIADDAKGAYQNLVDQSTAELKPVLEEYRKQEAGLAEFKRNNNIGPRAADDSKSREAWLWIAAIFVVECLVNAFVLRDVVPAGTAGALSMTLVITAVNVFFGALFIGEGWRSKNSIQGNTRVRGYVQVFFFSLLLIAFNILVGHGRDAMQRLEAELRSGGTIEAFTSVGINAWQQFLTDPFGFESFTAPLLMVAGFLSFAVASWKGYERDDPYPGYGRISRRTELARTDYLDQREERTEDLKKIHANALKNLDELVNEALFKRDEYDELRERGRITIEGLKMQMQHLGGILRELVQIYRDANVKARDSKEAPEYFSKDLTLRPDLLVPPEFSPPERPTVGVLADAVAEQKSSLQKQYDHLLTATFPKK